MHDGVDIAAPVGTPVLAADSGVVIFSGTLHGYGNTVIIRHDDGYATVYGHNSRNLVSEGTRVARGQEIGEIGRSGRTTGANLHFEVRRDNVAQNPLAYLPEPATSDRDQLCRGRRQLVSWTTARAIACNTRCDGINDDCRRNQKTDSQRS